MEVVVVEACWNKQWGPPPLQCLEMLRAGRKGVGEGKSREKDGVGMPGAWQVHCPSSHEHTGVMGFGVSFSLPAF